MPSFSPLCLLEFSQCECLGFLFIHNCTPFQFIQKFKNLHENFWKFIIIKWKVISRLIKLNYLVDVTTNYNTLVEMMENRMNFLNKHLLLQCATVVREMKIYWVFSKQNMSLDSTSGFCENLHAYVIIKLVLKKSV